MPCAELVRVAQSTSVALCYEAPYDADANLNATDSDD